MNRMNVLRILWAACFIAMGIKLILWFHQNSDHPINITYWLLLGASIVLSLMMAAERAKRSRPK